MQVELSTERNTAISADLKTIFGLIEKSVVALEPRFLNRALRTSASLRHDLNLKNLKETLDFVPNFSLFDVNIIHQTIGTSSSDSSAMQVDTTQNNEKNTQVFIPEKDAFVAYLAILYLHDQKEFAKGLSLSKTVLEAIQAINRRSMDIIASKIYFYFGRFSELQSTASTIRPFLLHAHRLATLRNDYETLAVLLNLILRNYIQFNLYEQADKLMSKSTFPETASSNQLARNMYYLGRIKAIQLDYTNSHQFLQQAIRKAPQNNHSAGFLQTVYKLSIIVQLLMGEIPDRAIFRLPALENALAPYLQITKAVRVGDLSEFQEALAQFGPTFRADNTFTLILRLRHNVIKAGIRKISLSYSRISLKDICLKLQLDSEEDAEYIVAKAIRDGVIDATIDHEGGFMKSKENADIYSTSEPQTAFHQRLLFCLNLHNESVKAMRFPSNDIKKDMALTDALMQEDRKLAAEIEDGTVDFDDEDMGEL